MSDRDSPVASPPPAEDATNEPVDDGGHDSDRDSDMLSDIDENEFDNYDPNTAQIEERPIEIDENDIRTLKASKRKRVDGATSKKPKEGRREKKRRTNPDDDDTPTGQVISGKRIRKSQTANPERRSKKSSPAPEENEDHLTPEQRRMRALDRAMDAAMKPTSKRRKKKDEVDLEAEVDEQIARLKVKMEEACRMDGESHRDEKPAVEKLKLLPQVLQMLKRTDIQMIVLDPETNFLQTIRFFLEPLDDGSLPAYNIQRDIMTALLDLPIEKDALMSSGIGKVVLYYTRSKQVEFNIKRMAERLVGEWSRPILKRSDNFKKRHIETRDYDHEAAKASQSSQFGSQGPQRSRADIEKERALAPIVRDPSRAQPVGLPKSYTIAPKTNFNPDLVQKKVHGAAGMAAFRKMTTKKKK